MEKLIQKYLIEFEMQITPYTIKLVKENYEIIHKRNYEYELTEHNKKEIDGKINYIKISELNIRTIESLIERNEKLLKDIKEKKNFFWFIRNKKTKTKEECETDMKLYKYSVTNKIKFNEMILERVEQIKKDNKLNFDIRNAVLMTKDYLKQI